MDAPGSIVPPRGGGPDPDSFAPKRRFHVRRSEQAVSWARLNTMRRDMAAPLQHAGGDCFSEGACAPPSQGAAPRLARLNGGGVVQWTNDALDRAGQWCALRSTLQTEATGRGLAVLAELTPSRHPADVYVQPICTQVSVFHLNLGRAMSANPGSGPPEDNANSSSADGALQNRYGEIQPNEVTIL